MMKLRNYLKVLSGVLRNKMKYEFISNSKEETIEFAKKLSKYFKVGTVITLEGDLGAGKTTFVKGVGQFLNVKEEINSPTFNILKCYFDGDLPLYHIDAYRLEDVSPENKNLGLEEVIEGNGICLIEWPKFIEEFIEFDKVLKINISYIENDKRKISLNSNNEEFKPLFEGI